MSDKGQRNLEKSKNAGWNRVTTGDQPRTTYGSKSSYSNVKRDSSSWTVATDTKNVHVTDIQFIVQNINDRKSTQIQLTSFFTKLDYVSLNKNQNIAWNKVYKSKMKLLLFSMIFIFNL